MSTIGFDTSNYTTSTAWTDGKTDINVRQILYVKDGERRFSAYEINAGDV